MKISGCGQSIFEFTALSESTSGKVKLQYRAASEPKQGTESGVLISVLYLGA